ncbi:hypothetical protein RvY_13707 [Ramazzottius varieornatus]|uniref:Uncharacterized protein n=1 Tax=Ramazzottius varieornatus TaxID=947166 RepID=A0A1D1VNU9_RAMVA|nr:hypothetical protein RvY_13707 [Ramazzottius varieornatus]
MAKYNAYQQNYAAYETLAFEGLAGQISLEQKAKFSKKYAKPNLQEVIEAEESRKMKAIDRHQEEEFLKVAMNPSVPQVESVRANARNSIMSPKRSSIFNLQMDRLRIDPMKASDEDSLYDILSGKKPDMDPQSGILSSLDRTRAESSLMMDQVPQSPPLKDAPVAPPEPACAVHDPDSLYSKLFTSVLPLNVSDRPCYGEDSSGLRGVVSSTLTVASEVNVPKVRKPHVDAPFNAQFIGPLDPLARAAGIEDDFAIYPAEEPPVFVKTCCQVSAKPADAQAKSDPKREDSDGLDDYNEKELVELPPTFGPSQPIHRDSKLTGAAGNTQANVVDYRAIFTKCYRNGRRKTRALLEADNTFTRSDVVDDRVTEIATSIPFEPLVQEWFALASGFQEGALRDIDYESLIPLLYLGLEEVVRQAAKRGLLPLGDEPRDEADLIDDPDFDPLELLGVYLLRHNPAHDASWESNPYVHSFRRVVRQIRNEVLLEQPIGGVGDLAKVFAEENISKGGSKVQNGVLSSVLNQSSSKKSRLADGIWDAYEDPAVLLSPEARSTLLKVVAKLSKEDEQTKEMRVDLQLLSTLLLTYVEDIHSLEFPTKGMIWSSGDCFPHTTTLVSNP